MYKRLIYFFTIVTAVTIAFLVNSCQQSPITPTESPMMDAGNGCDSANVFCGSPGTIQIQNPCPGDVQTIDLWAGAGNPAAGVLVGRVEFYPVSGNTWKVKYVFTNFDAHEIHFSIKCQLSEIPQKNGNPIPGRFQYKFNGPFPGGVKEFNITLPAGCSCFYVAAHAAGTVLGGGIECFNENIPSGCVNITNLQHGFTNQADTGCYWNFNLSNAGTFNGNYCGWCMDLGTGIENSIYNCAHMFSSLEPFPEYMKPFIEGWQEMDKINYLINHFEVGQTVQLKGVNCADSGGTDVLTAMDIQKAIWMILDMGPGIQRPEWEALSTPGKRNAIVCDVMANGEGFVPSCQNGDLIVFIIDPGQNPNQTQAQPIFAAAPCCEEQGGNETAWADAKFGGSFPGNNWATYFKWCPTCQ
jgi:hypothetical protein